MQRIIKTHLHAGLTAPVRLLQVTDCHLTESTENDLPSQRELLAHRKESFRREGGFPPKSTNEYLEETFSLANELDALPILTGDIYDLNSEGNRLEMARILAGHDFMYTPGGHEFQRICKRNSEEPPEYYPAARAQVVSSFPTLNFNVDSRIINGLQIITCDSNQENFDLPDCEKVHILLDSGLPTVFFTHVPLTDPNLTRQRENVIFTVPRTEEQEAANKGLIERLERDRNVIAIVAGHWHRETEWISPAGIPMFVTPGLFAGVCRLLVID